MTKQRQTPRSLMARGSKVVKEDYQDPETGEWRVRIRMSNRKFDDSAKQTFLEEYRKWGRMGEAAAKVGVVTSTVRKAIYEDEEFAEALLEAETEYQEKLIGHHQNLIFEGIEKKHYDRQGNLVSVEKQYPIRLIELELKKHDKGYREKQEVDITHKGGVLVAPADMGTIDDWESKFNRPADHPDLIENG